MNILQPLAPFYIETGLHIYESGGANPEAMNAGENIILQ